MKPETVNFDAPRAVTFSKAKIWLAAAFVGVILLSATVAQAATNDPVVATLVKHLQTSRDFTLKVGDAMPEANFDFKLTPEQMSFRDQLTHIAKLDGGLSAGLDASGSKPPASAGTSKAATLAFVKQSYDYAIAVMEKLTAADMQKSYKTIEGNITGLNALLLMLDHSTHHRAQCEMYLRAKGITPPSYTF